MTTANRPLRVALLSYRGSPFSGGQGVYVRYLSKALVELGHSVTVFGGQPYPDLHEGAELVRLPSLDLYRADDPFRTPSREEFRDAIDALEYTIMCGAGFPEPLTFSLRAAREIGRQPRPFDVIHDNQCLGYGLLRMQARGQKVIATIHHPCSIDRDIEVAAAPDWKRKASLRRWYGFTKMQARVAQRLSRAVTVSEIAKEDVVRELGVEPGRVAVVHNGVDTDLFKPDPDKQRVAGRLVTTASSNVPLKGLLFLIEALAKVRTERPADLTVIGHRPESGPVADALERFGVAPYVSFEPEVSWDRLVELYNRAEVAVVPSLYEGFSLPAAEAMASGTALIATTAGALPEVAGTDGQTALLVPPKDAGALATAIARLLDDASLRERIAAAGRQRVLERFTWRAAAEATVEEYRQVMEPC